MESEIDPYWSAMVVANRIIACGPVINFGVCASMLDRAGAHKCAALAREMPRDSYLGDSLLYQFKREWLRFEASHV